MSTPAARRPRRPNVTGGNAARPRQPSAPAPQSGRGKKSRGASSTWQGGHLIWIWSGGLGVTGALVLFLVVRSHRSAADDVAVGSAAAAAQPVVEMPPVEVDVPTAAAAAPTGDAVPQVSLTAALAAVAAIPDAPTPGVSPVPAAAAADANPAPEIVSPNGSHSTSTPPVAATATLDRAAEKWLSDFSGQQAELAGRLASLSMAQARDAVLKPEWYGDLLRHEILRQAPPEELRRFLKQPAEQAVLLQLLSQPDWMVEVVGSGPVDRLPVALTTLVGIVRHDPAAAQPGLARKIATSAALETSLQDKSPMQGLRTYEYYRDRHEARRLNPGFAELQVWEMRFAVNGRFSADDLTWIGDRASFSPQDANGAAWQVPYLGENPFGDSVQSSWYYMPWAAANLTYCEQTVRIGGVCGSLSTTGALSAQADGIPATTMGEPGHCAFCVRVEPGVWESGNTVDGNNRSPHRCFFRHNWSDLFAGDAAWLHPGLKQAQGLAWAAMATPSSDVPRRTEWLQQAVAADPLHFGYQEEFLKSALAQNMDGAARRAAAAEIVSAFPRFPQTSYELLKLLTDKASPEDRREIQRLWLASYQQPVEDRIDQMPLDSIVSDMAKARGEAGQAEFVNDALELTFGSEKIFPRFLDACQKLAEKNPALREAVLAGLTKVATSSAGEAGDDTLKALCRKGILLAEASNDRASFKAMSELGARFISDTFKVQHKPYPGQLLSAGGLVHLSSTSQWDEPLTHAGVLAERGGRFHTNSESQPGVVVELGTQGTIRGIAVVNIDGQNQGRAVPLVVSTSIDGKTWNRVYRSEKVEKVWQIDVKGRRPLAKYVKINVDRPENEKTFLHLNGVYVYGTPAQ